MVNLKRALAGLLISLTTGAIAQDGYVYSDIHDFGGEIKLGDGKSSADGNEPIYAPSFDSLGNAYGSTQSGGANNDGMVWMRSRAGVYTDLHDFGYNSDGSNPFGTIAIDKDGDLYGTTYGGGAYGGGVLWETTKAGDYRILHNFGAGSDGASPCAGVNFDPLGNLYGTTESGGAYRGGIVWEFTVAGLYQDLHDFGSGSDGFNPTSAVTVDSSGNLYGTTLRGGPSYYGGIVWEIPKRGAYRDLHDFEGTVTYADGTSGVDGFNPYSGVTTDGSGNLYGTTMYGGEYDSGLDAGTLWKISKSGVYSILHNFGGTAVRPTGTTATDGEQPYFGNLLLTGSGVLVGTTWFGGQNNSGVVWQYTAEAKYVVLHDFGGTVTCTDGSAGPDGYNPECGVSQDAAGNIYGTSISGGEFFSSIDPAGVIWELNVLPKLTSITAPSSLTGGSNGVGRVTLSAPAQADITVTFGSSDPTVASGPQSITIPAGATSATFNVKSDPVAAAQTVTIGAHLGASSMNLTILVLAPALTNLEVPDSLVGGASGTGTITLSGPAPSGGLTVTVGSSDPEAASGPPSLIIPAGSTSATFRVKTYTVASARVVTIGAHLGISSANTMITVNP